MSKINKEPKPKVVFAESFTCPHCKKPCIIKKSKKKIADPVPAKYDEKVEVVKDDQQKLK